MCDNYELINPRIVIKTRLVVRCLFLFTCSYCICEDAGRHWSRSCVVQPSFFLSIKIGYLVNFTFTFLRSCRICLAKVQDQRGGREPSLFSTSGKRKLTWLCSLQQRKEEGAPLQRQHREHDHRLWWIQCSGAKRCFTGFVIFFVFVHKLNRAHLDLIIIILTTFTFHSTMALTQHLLFVPENLVSLFT